MLTFEHRHPFPAPDFSAAISGSNRADLGYTGRLLILAEAASSDFFDASVRLDPWLVKNADGYCNPGDLLATQLQGTNNTFPYMLLADEAKDNRIGISNSGSPAGSYDPVLGGWQRANSGDGTDWTGHDFLHDGQAITNTIALRAAALTSGPQVFRVAVLIKYTDPRGVGGRSMRFPPATVDVTQFAYRLPFANLDVSQVVDAGSVLTIGDSAGSTAALALQIRDWDAQASEAGDADLSDEGDVSLIQPGASGLATALLDAPALSATPVAILPAGTASGLPGDEIPYGGILTNSLGTAAPGVHPVCIAVSDPELGDPAAATYHKGVDPHTLVADPARAIAAQTWQVLLVAVEASTVTPPTITGVIPTGAVGLYGDPVTFSATTTGDPATSWSWDFAGGATPGTSTDAEPEVTLGAAGTYATAAVTASNAGGSSAPFVFSYTVSGVAGPPTWSIHAVTGAKDQYQALVVLDGRLALAYATNVATADLRFARATVAVPTAAGHWTQMNVDTSQEVGYTPSIVVLPSGHVAIAYRDWTNKDLKVSRALTLLPDTVADWHVHTAESAGDVGHYTSLAAIGGLMAVAHTDFGFPNRPRYSRATSATPTSAGDWTGHQVEASGGGYTPSLLEFEGRPALFYSVGGGLRYARAANATPSSAVDWALHTADTDGVGCDWPSATVVGGKLAVAYCPRQGGDLKVALATVTEPLNAGHWQTHLIETPGDTGFFPSMIALGGRLAISYMDFTPKDFKVARAMVAEPTSAADWEIQLVDDVNVTGGTTRLVDLNGVLAASYYYPTGGQVKVAIASHGW